MSEILNVDIVSIKLVREDVAKYNTQIENARAIIDMLHPLYDGIDREKCVVVGLNSHHVPNSINTVSIGTIDRSYMVPREVFKPLILSNCSAFIIVHNHPGGSLEPSEADKKMTKILSQLGNDLGFKMLDHLIITNGGQFYSFRENIGI